MRVDGPSDPVEGSLWDDAPDTVRVPAATRPGERLGPKVLSVGDLTRLVRDAVRRASGLQGVWVEGEVGQVTVSSAGHSYFTLKDDRAQVRCMIFRDDRLAMPLEPRTGIRLVAHGRVDVFEPQGTYQLYVDSLQPVGIGELALRLEALKARLAAEGLFEAGRKRPLPPYPRTIGICTSLTGAVLHDIRDVIARRWPLARIVVSACLVQGPGAADSIVRALRRIGRWTDPGSGRAVDVVILARGGGSLEDLWAFNEEAVVRAVAVHPRPIVVGVGHETDTTLAEFAADVRAATPSVAAALATPDRAELGQRLDRARAMLATSTRRRLGEARSALAAEDRALARARPGAALAAERERAGLLLDRATRVVMTRLADVDRELETHSRRLEASLAARSRAVRGELEAHARRLDGAVGSRSRTARVELTRSGASLVALSPFGTLERGYAIVRDPDGHVVTEAASQATGAPLDVLLARGALHVRVEGVRDSRS
jgi:exodeoxyribonuclease VII large subunit